MADAVIGALRVNLGMDTAAFQKGADTAQSRLDGLKRGLGDLGSGKFQQGFQGIARSIGLVGPAAAGTIPALTAMATAVAAATAGVVVIIGALSGAAQAVGSFINEADQLNDLALQTSLTAESFQEIDYALRLLAGATTDETVRAFRNINGVFAEAIEGNQNAINSLGRLGISLQDVKNGTVSTEQAFDALIATLKSAKTDAEAVSLASEIFGDKLGRILGPALRANSEAVNELRQEARQLGIISEDTTKKAGEFGDELDKLQQAFKGLLSELVPYVLPALIDFIKNLTEIIKWTNSTIEKIENLGNTFTNFAADVLDTLGPLGKFIAAMVGIRRVVGEDLATEVRNTMTSMRAEIEAQTQQGIARQNFRPQEQRKTGGSDSASMAEENKSIEELFLQRMELEADYREFQNEERMAYEEAEQALLERDLERIAERTAAQEEYHQKTLDAIYAIANATGIATDASQLFGEIWGRAAGVASAAIMGVTKVLAQVFGKTKEFAIAETIINTIAAVVKAWRDYGWPWGAVVGAAIAVAGAAQVAQIASTEPGSGGSVSAGSAGAAQNVAQSQPSTTQAVSISLAGDTFNRDGVVRLIENINDAVKDGAVLMVNPQ